MALARLVVYVTVCVAVGPTLTACGQQSPNERVARAYMDALQHRDYPHAYQLTNLATRAQGAGDALSVQDFTAGVSHHRFASYSLQQDVHFKGAPFEDFEFSEVSPGGASSRDTVLVSGGRVQLDLRSIELEVYGGEAPGILVDGVPVATAPADKRWTLGTSMMLTGYSYYVYTLNVLAGDHTITVAAGPASLGASVVSASGDFGPVSVELVPTPAAIASADTLVRSSFNRCAHPGRLVMFSKHTFVTDSAAFLIGAGEGPPPGEWELGVTADYSIGPEESTAVYFARDESPHLDASWKCWGATGSS